MDLRRRFYPWPKPDAERGGAGSTLASFGEPAAFLNLVRPIRKTLRDKGGRYGALDRPYVIAILVADPMANELDVVNALFGDVRVSVPVVTGRRGAPLLRRARTGFWSGPPAPRYTRVSAVTVAINLAPSTLRSVEPVTWLNPWAARPLTVELPWSLRVVDPGSGVISAGWSPIPSATLFGLPPDWPGPEEPFPAAESGSVDQAGTERRGALG